MLLSEEQAEMVRAINLVQDSFETALQDNMARVRINSSMTVDVGAIALAAIKPLRECCTKLSESTELQKASYFGDAFELTDFDQCPDRVKGCPLLLVHMEVFSGETSPEKAAEVFGQNDTPPTIIRGRCEGMKELVCRMIHFLYAMTRGDI